MGVKGGKKGGRTVSKVKRSNQRMNKMVKQGKAKPKSKPRYIPNAKNKKSGEQSEKEAWLTPELRAQWARSQEEDADAALEQLAEEVRAGQDGQQLAARLKATLKYMRHNL